MIKSTMSIFDAFDHHLRLDGVIFAQKAQGLIAK